MTRSTDNPKRDAGKTKLTPSRPAKIPLCLALACAGVTLVLAEQAYAHWLTGGELRNFPAFWAALANGMFAVIYGWWYLQLRRWARQVNELFR